MRSSLTVRSAFLSFSIVQRGLDVGASSPRVFRIVDQAIGWSVDSLASSVDLNSPLGSQNESIRENKGLLWLSEDFPTQFPVADILLTSRHVFKDDIFAIWGDFLDGNISFGGFGV